VELDVAARGGDRGREHRPVRLVDLAGGERFPRPRELGPRREHGDPRTACAVDLGHARRGKRPDGGGAEPHSGRDDDLARTQVAAAWANVRTRLRSLVNDNVVVMMDNILDGDDGIGARGDDAAGRDAHRLARTERPRRGSAGGDVFDDGKASRQVRCTHRESVHRRALERRQVDERASVFAEHAAGGLGDRHRLQRQRPDSLQDTLLGLRHGE